MSSFRCCVVRGVFQVPQAACGRSVTRHSLPEDAFEMPTCSVGISPSRSVPPHAYQETEILKEG